ncbi:MAG: phosphodiester glycosidase family protein [Verrucomicrobiota bacterium]
MNRFLCTAFFSLLFSQTLLAADWKLVNETVRSERTSPNLIYVKRIVQLVPGRTATFELTFFRSAECRLDVIDLPRRSSLNGSALSAKFRERSCLAGVNGGFFAPDHQPLGLVVSNGTRTNRISSSKLLSGVVYSDHKGIHIVRRSAFRDHSKINALLQSGPYLVEHANAIRGLEATKSRRRTFIATDWRGNWAIGVTSSVTLADLAQILASSSPVTGWKVNRAINLDGGSSTGFYFDRATESDIASPPWKPVRNLLGVRPK